MTAVSIKNDTEKFKSQWIHRNSFVVLDSGKFPHLQLGNGSRARSEGGGLGGRGFIKAIRLSSKSCWPLYPCAGSVLIFEGLSSKQQPCTRLEEGRPQLSYQLNYCLSVFNSDNSMIIPPTNLPQHTASIMWCNRVSMTVQ